MRNRIFLLIAIVCVVGVLQPAIQQLQKVAEKQQAATVAVVPVRSGATTTEVMAEGTIVPGEVANVSVLPSFEGQVKRIFVTNGSRVTKGQVLAELDPVEQQSQLSQSLALLQGARAQHLLTLRPHRPEEFALAEEAVRSARAQYDLVCNPHRPEEVEQMKLKLQSDQATIAAAEAKLAILRNGSRSQQIADANASVSSAQAKLKLAVSDLDRNKVLFSRDLISRAEFELSETAVTLARNALIQAQESLSLLQEGARQEEIGIAEADLQKAKYALEQDQQAYAVLTQGSRPEEIEKAKSELAQAKLKYEMLLKGSRQEQVQQTAAQLKRAQLQVSHQASIIERRLVRAPISGVVIARNINVGEIASPGAPRSDGSAPLTNNVRSLFILAEDRAVEFMASVDQRFYHRLHVGQEASVGIEAYPGRTFTGKIVRMNPLINPDRIGRGGNNVNNPASPLTFTVWIRLPNPDKLLVSGQIGVVNFRSATGGLLIPQSAVSSFALGEGTVFVVENGIARSRAIQYDGNSDGDLRVLSGLEAGEQVVISNTKNLRDGMRVKSVAATDFADNSKPF